MGARPSTLNTTAMTARMDPLLIKTSLALVVIVAVIRLAMIRPEPLLRLGQIPRSTYQNASTSAVGHYLSKTTIRWLILRNYLAVGDLLAGYYRILAWAAGMTTEIGIGTGIDTDGDDDFLCMHYDPATHPFFLLSFFSQSFHFSFFFTLDYTTQNDDNDDEIGDDDGLRTCILSLSFSSSS